MRRTATTLLIAILALTVLGAKRRAIETPLCATLSELHVLISYRGAWSGCSDVSRGACHVDEPIELRVLSWAYNSSCGAHRAIVTFGDGTAGWKETVRGLPTFEHHYRAAGVYRIFATVSNGRSVVTTSREIRLTGGAF